MAGIHKLNQKTINEAERTATKLAAPVRLSDGGGLSLHVRPQGSLYWAVQVTIKAVVGNGKRVEIGLGRYPTISLQAARTLAVAKKAIADTGIDPREAAKKVVAANQRKKPTFKHVMDLTFEAIKGSLRGGGVSGRWASPLNIHVLPTLGDKPIEEITKQDLVECMRGPWKDIYPTATKCLERIGLVFKHAEDMDLKVSFDMVQSARRLLGKSDHKVENIPSMPWAEVPAYYAGLQEDLLSNLALKLLILTGVRSKAVRYAHKSQFDGNVWTVPAELMKGKEGKVAAFRVPLSTEAQRIVAKCLFFSKSGFLFPNPERGIMSDMAMSKYMADAKLPYRPHGFRSSLRGWMVENTSYSFEIVETVLAHKVGNSVTQAYMREDYLTKRQDIMEAWAKYVTGQTVVSALRIVA